jgi:hypothetical protein
VAGRELAKKSRSRRSTVLLGGDRAKISRFEEDEWCRDFQGKAPALRETRDQRCRVSTEGLNLVTQAGEGATEVLLLQRRLE